jgi:hypothetical protein
MSILVKSGPVQTTLKNLMACTLRSKLTSALETVTEREYGGNLMIRNALAYHLIRAQLEEMGILPKEETGVTLQLFLLVVRERIRHFALFQVVDNVSIPWRRFMHSKKMLLRKKLIDWKSITFFRRKPTKVISNEFFRTLLISNFHVELL